MGTKIYAVIDTNVLVSALFSISSQSNPSTVVRKIIDGTLLHFTTTRYWQNT